MAPSVRNLLLFAAFVASSVAVPATDYHSSFQLAERNDPISTSRTLFQRLRNSVIERIWHIPKKSDCHRSSRKSEYNAPSNFRTKHGTDQVLRFNISSEDEAGAFSEAANILYLDIWDHSENWVDVRVAKTVLPSLLNLLPTSLQNAHAPLMHDLAQAIYDTYPSSSKSQSWRVRHDSKYKFQTDIFFDDWQPLSVYYPWLQFLAARYKNYVEYFSIGKSAEGRDIPALRVSAPLQDQVPNEHVVGRSTILVVGGSHAREWVSTSTTAYLAYSFASQYGVDEYSTFTAILKNFDIVFIPILNPDGYEYTWSNDRLWRKNRQATSLPFCPGIDLDRAFDFKWDGEKNKDNPCMESYAGEHAFQAVEAQVLAEWARKQTLENHVVWSTFLDLHSYSQKILYPYSYSCNVEAHNLEDLQELGIGLAKAFRMTSGHNYAVTSACQSQITFETERNGKKPRAAVNGGGETGGSILDYFYEVLRVEWAYSIKLRDTGTYGFLLQKEDIVPAGRETLQALVSLGRFLLSNKGIESIGTEEVDEELVKVESVTGSVSQQSTIQSPESLFRLSHNDMSIHITEEDGDSEWERVYDAELRRRT